MSGRRSHYNGTRKIAPWKNTHRKISYYPNPNPNPNPNPEGNLLGGNLPAGNFTVGNFPVTHYNKKTEITEMVEIMFELKLRKPCMFLRL